MQIEPMAEWLVAMACTDHQGPVLSALPQRGAAQPEAPSQAQGWQTQWLWRGPLPPPWQQ